MSRQSYDRKLEEIEALRSAPEDSAREQLRRALKDRSNYAVAKAAAITAARRFEELLPDLLAAFDRFMMNPVKSDPQCWAKNAVARALKDLGHANAAVFFRGIAHFHMEPVWGGRQDTAATLRATCALALIGSSAGDFEILTRLTDLLNDPEAPVRIDAARAMAQLSAKEGILPLRLKALFGDSDPQVVGHCLAALLALSPQDSLTFVAGFLESRDPDVQVEAAAVLAESREPSAMDYLKEFWEGLADPSRKRTVLQLLAASPLESAAEFLLTVIRDASDETAVAAVNALSKSRYRNQFHLRAAGLVAARKSPSLNSAFHAAFSSASNAR